jgi:hypothetical protein
MKTSGFVGTLIACAVVVAGVYLTNIGQEMAVRAGQLSTADLQRLPSPSILAQARAATSATDVKVVMRAFHTILNAQLILIVFAGLGGAALVIRRTRTAQAGQPALFGKEGQEIGHGGRRRAGGAGEDVRDDGSAS